MIKGHNTENGDNFGKTVSLSDDGNTLAVGAWLEDSNTIGIDTIPNNAGGNSGAAYVFTRTGTAWSQQAYIKAGAGNTADERFGKSVSLSGDGNTLAVGAHKEDSDTVGINSMANELGPGSGAAYVFSRSGTDWSQQSYIKASNTDDSDRFGWTVRLSSDGNTLAVGARDEASGSSSDESDNTQPAAGAVYVFSRSVTDWSQQAYIKTANPLSNDHFGGIFDLSGDGNMLAVGFYFEDSDTTGITSTANDRAESSGAVNLYSRSGVSWIQQAYIKSSNTETLDNFGDSVSLGDNGNILAVGAGSEDGSATGVGGASDEGAFAAGAVYLY